MESSKGKLCPLSYTNDLHGEICRESKCALWSASSDCCEVPLMIYQVVREMTETIKILQSVIVSETK